MNLRGLKNGEMISATAPLAEPGSKARKAAESNALTAVVLGKVVEAHDGMESLKRPLASVELATIIGKLADLDARHDTIARGIQDFFSSLIKLGTKEARIAELTALLIFLLPDGLTIIGRSYLEEAGQLRNLKSTMSPAQVTLMKGLQVDDITLHDVFVEWCEIGEQMRVLDLERAVLEVNKPTSPTRAENAQARNAWITAVNGLITMADLAQLPEDTHKEIFGQLDALLARTAQRGKKPVAKEQPAPAPKPETDPTADGAE